MRVDGTSSGSDSTATAFVEWLLGVARRAQNPEHPDPAARATLAILRRGLGKDPGAFPEVDRIILKHLSDASHRSQRMAYIIGPLFALHEQGSRDGVGQDPPRSLGRSLAVLRRRKQERAKEQGSSERVDPTERRALQLLGSHRADLPDRLRRIVLLLKAENVGINWLRLWADIDDWDNPRRTVQHRWAMELWQPDRSGASTTSGQLDPIDSGDRLDGKEEHEIEDDED